MQSFGTDTNNRYGGVVDLLRWSVREVLLHTYTYIYIYIALEMHYVQYANTISGVLHQPSLLLLTINSQALFYFQLTLNKCSICNNINQRTIQN